MYIHSSHGLPFRACIDYRELQLFSAQQQLQLRRPATYMFSVSANYFARSPIARNVVGLSSARVLISRSRERANASKHYPETFGRRPEDSFELCRIDKSFLFFFFCYLSITLAFLFVERSLEG